MTGYKGGGMCVNMSQLFLALILLVKEYRAMCPDHVWWGYNSVFIEIKSIYVLDHRRIILQSNLVNT